MTAARFTSPADRRLLAAIRRPCPGCRWCLTRRVLTAVWRGLVAVGRGLVMASRVVVAVRRALMVCAFIGSVTYAIENETGRLIGIAAVVAWVMAGAAVLVWLNRSGRR